MIRAAWQLIIERDFDGGVTRHEDAFRKNPNSVWICGADGFAHSLCREPERALEISTVRAASVPVISACSFGFPVVRSRIGLPADQSKRSSGPTMPCGVILDI